jgi:hypothetical protein
MYCDTAVQRHKKKGRRAGAGDSLFAGGSGLRCRYDNPDVQAAWDQHGLDEANRYCGVRGIYGTYYGLCLSRKTARGVSGMAALPDVEISKSWWVQLVFFGLLVAIMIFVTEKNWVTSVILTVALIPVIVLFYSRGEFKTLMDATYQFVRFILPWFLIGAIGATLVAVFIPESVVSRAAGGSSLLSCFISSVFGSVMYLCPPSEVLFTRAFVDLGMGQGPALSFILTSPAVSLPSIIVMMKLIGWKKTLTYIALLIILAAVAGYAFGHFVA